MPKSHFYKIGNLFRFILLFSGVVLLSYCTSSPHQTAASFGKRKYTKGHFYDPAAKTKTDYFPSGANTTISSANVLQKTGTNNTSFTNHRGDAGAPFNISIKAPVSNGTNRDISVAKSPAGYTNSNSSLNENSQVYPDHGYNDHEDQHRDRSQGLLIAWIVCGIIAIVCFLLLVSLIGTGGFGSGEIGAGCLLYFFGIFGFIAAIVLFILWVIAISR